MRLCKAGAARGDTASAGKGRHGDDSDGWVEVDEHKGNMRFTREGARITDLLKVLP